MSLCILAARARRYIALHMNLTFVTRSVLFLPSCVRPLLPSYLPSVIAAFVGINQLSVGREVGSDAKEDHYLALPEAFFRAGNEPKFGLDSLSKA